MRNNTILSCLVVGTLFLHHAYANTSGFITIIGPDGLPMVVPHPESSKEEKASSSNHVPQTTKSNTETKTSSVNSPSIQTLSPPPEPTQGISEEQSQPYRLIEGEKYYEAEYLESKEFNLDNKKRFYQIPTGSGAANWDVVEREKGADMSWFQASKAMSVKPEVIVLGTDYTVIPKDELVAVLPIQCVDDKAKRKSKTFQKDNTLALFPRRPFKDEFDYELVQLNSSVQNFRLESYASSQKNPTYYWPIVIFLDEKGCMIEGASAFYTKSQTATALQSESIEGVVHVPEQSRYVMLTALEQAMDVPELKLSNQGQIKLTVLR